MGWNEARIELVPDRWQFVVEETTAPTASGKHLNVVSTERISDSTANVLYPNQFEQWLLKVGVVPHEKRKSVANYLRDDILVEVYSDNDEVSSISVQFTLSRDSPQHWTAWHKLIQNIYGQWPVAIGDAETGMKVGPDQLFSVLRRTLAWQDFEAQFGWPMPIPPENSV